MILAGGLAIFARSVVIASGARYRQLNVKNQGDFENRGLYYAATAMESLLCRDREIIVVGGGNSAGQAAMFFSGYARNVTILVRGPSLSQSMSQYLIEEIGTRDNIAIRANGEIVAVEGGDHLNAIVVRDLIGG